VTLVDYFPNITTLRLRSFALEPDEGPIPTLARPLRVKVYIEITRANCLEFSDRLAKLDIEYEELVVGSLALSPFGRAKSVESSVQISTCTIEYLRLAAGLERE